MKFVNLTKHEIKDLISGEYYPVPENSAVVNVDEVIVSEEGGTQITKLIYKDIVGLPNPVDGVRYIVSAVILNALNGSRNDCVAPARPLRDSKGAVLGCRGFRTNG